MTFLNFLHRAADGHALTAAEAEQAMTLVLQGQASTAQLTAFLVAIRLRGESSQELLGFARAMRAAAVPVSVTAQNDALLDTCGTGGDGCHTFNISTVTAFVVAAAGVRVAKHGNRAASSPCGSADLLEALGVNIELSPEQMAVCLKETGIGFLYAPVLHPAMRYAREARRELKLRTVFNLLGPLTNPASATAQLVGAPSESSARLMAEVLAQLGLPRGFVVHGAGGLDEVSLSGPTVCYEVTGEKVVEHRWEVTDFALPQICLKQIQTNGLQENVELARRILANDECGPACNIVLANAAAALLVTGRVDGLQSGVSLAADVLQSGAAWEKLEALVRVSRRFA